MEDVKAIGGQNLGHRLVLKRTDHQISFLSWNFIWIVGLLYLFKTSWYGGQRCWVNVKAKSFVAEWVSHLSWLQVLVSGVSSFFFIGDTSHRTVIRGSKLGAETWTSSHSRSTFIKSQRACSAFISLPGQDPKLQWAVHLCLSKSLSGTLSIHLVHVASYH